MKKCLLTSILLTLFLLAGCCNNIQNTQKEAPKNQDINDILTSIVHNHSVCGDDSELFVDYALLGSSIKDNGNYEYYLVTNGQGFFIDERGNLNNSCGFGGVPTVIELSQNENGYNLVEYKTAEDGNRYDSSTEEMFSEEAYKIWKDAKYKFNNKKTFLEQAEEYFNVKVIPEGKNNYECPFCDKLWYVTWDEDDEEALKSNDLIFNYTTIDNGNNTIYFGSNGNFEAKGSWDEGKGTRTFGKDENTVLVTNSTIDHVYDRYIITNQTEDSLNTILEIIQRM